MTAAALGVVVFAALVMAAVGLSYAMGAFIAGVTLAGSSYRHEVEADVEPFRGLFMGLAGNRDPYGQHAPALEDWLAARGADLDARRIEAGHDVVQEDLAAAKSWLERRDK